MKITGMILIIVILEQMTVRVAYKHVKERHVFSKMKIPGSIFAALFEILHLGSGRKFSIAIGKEDRQR
nr:hypothetical protein [Tanacetum cinerariifolium]